MSTSKTVRRRTYGSVLDAFRRLGRAATPPELAQELQVAEAVIVDNLRALEAGGTLRLDSGRATILDAYPYSAVPTRHTVRLPDGPPLHCMCAIDVFYVPFLTHSDASIESHCHYCDAAIHIRVNNGVIGEVDPSGTVIWHSAAAYDCPLTNFFCSSGHLELWHGGVPTEPGQQIDLVTALDRGRVAAARIQAELVDPQTTDSRAVTRESTITCPSCGMRKKEIMPLDACVFFYECDGCGALLRPQPEDCCVFCSYGSIPCPPVQTQRTGATNAE